MIRVCETQLGKHSVNVSSRNSYVDDLSCRQQVLRHVNTVDLIDCNGFGSIGFQRTNDAMNMVREVRLAAKWCNMCRWSRAFDQ